MRASQLKAGDMYINWSGIFARDVLDVVDGLVLYQQYDYPEGRPGHITTRCLTESFRRWAGRRLDDQEAERIREIGRPIQEERFRQEQSLWSSDELAPTPSEFLRRNMAARLCELPSVGCYTLRELLTHVPDEEIATEYERRGLGN